MFQYGSDERDQCLMFFDCECTQDDGQHVPNICVVQNESGDEKVFSGPNTKDEFCEWLFTRENANTTFIAHNFQAYEGYFIMQYLYKNGIVPEVITRGDRAKILSLSVPELNIKFIDSLCFIPMRLANLPKTFGITEKGFFPHFFNRAENQNYVGPLPEARFYEPNGSSPDDRKKLFAWYNYGGP